MDTLEHIINKYKLDISYATPENPIFIPIGRFKDIPRLFRELGFKIGAEIGVFEGDYSRWLLKGIPGLKLYGVDAWTVYDGYKDYSRTTMSGAMEKAKKNVFGYDCELMKGWSEDIVKQFADESLDFVFIDGNHDYEHCVQDIALWSKKVRKGGIVYGHDYDDYSNHRRAKEMNVMNAVDGWMKSYKIYPWFVITHNRNKCWMYVKS